MQVEFSQVEKENQLLQKLYPIVNKVKAPVPIRPKSLLNYYREINQVAQSLLSQHLDSSQYFMVGARANKRPRRRSDEIERIYQCFFCEKGYGSISHLNTHIKLKSHGEIMTKSRYNEILSQLQTNCGK
eukprot:NODE_1422_length_1098_cov_1.086086.p1 type:complete len:129 gc:universal NODE_1422_length_1098_cov_1.086086:664-278(-)